MIQLSQSAINQIEKLSKENAKEGHALRISVEAGGCSGFEYSMSFDQEKADDNKIEQGGITVLVDPDSASYLDGCSIHFDDGLRGKGFEIQNPNASNTCGCGRSFN